MMDIMTSKRIAKLDSLTNCPCCGAPRGLALGGRKNRKVAFSCDAIFAVEPGQPIRCLLPCPAPSNTAADLLELEIVQADHFADALNYTLGGADEKAHARPPAVRKRLSRADVVVGAKLMTRDGRTATITDVNPGCDHSRKPIEGRFPDGSLGNWMMSGSVWVNGQVAGGDLVGVAPPSPQEDTDAETLAAAGIAEVIQDGVTTVILNAGPVSFGNSPSYFPYTASAAKIVEGSPLITAGDLLVKRLEEAPAPAPDVTGWQAMATAPLDKTPVIIAVPTEHCDDWIVGEAYHDPEHYEGGDWWWAGTRHDGYDAGPISDCNHHAPEYWQPMPSIPPTNSALTSPDLRETGL